MILHPNDALEIMRWIEICFFLGLMSFIAFGLTYILFLVVEAV